MDSNRVGEVMARCDISAGHHLSDCRVLASEGGSAFVTSLLGWLARPDLLAATTLPEDHARTRDYCVQFAPNGYPGITFGPVSSRTPPPVPRKGVSNCGFQADCAIKPGGLPQDCRIIGLEPDDPDAKAALAWLRDAEVRFQDWPDINGGARRIVPLTLDTSKN
jgi:hypothetical protein